jgi:hypothetical protein
MMPRYTRSVADAISKRGTQPPDVAAMDVGAEGERRAVAVEPAAKH